MKHSHGAASLLKSKPALTGMTILVTIAVGLLILSGLSAVQAQSAEQFFTYEENSPDPVANFYADDPEDASPGWWSLTAAAVDVDGDGATDGAGDVTAADIADRALFKVDQNGALSFRSPRSYEDNSASFTSGSPAPTDKQYRVTVQYSDGLNTEYFEAYVTVTDVEETGRVGFGLSGTGDASISVPLPETVVWQQFQPGAGLESRVTDPDSATRGNVVPTADITFKWYRVDQNGEETLIAGANERTYSPVVQADVGHHIKVEATYSDGKGPSETVTYTSVNAVQPYRRPVDNKIPSFPSAAITRRVMENSDGAFGGPIPATDPDGDLLTYTVRGADASISFGVPRFAIDNATGRLMMAPGVRLNYEADNEYTVMVRAYDSAANNSGADTDPQVTVETTVTIQVINVDEKPTFDAGTVPAGIVMAQTEGRTAIDLDNDIDTADPGLATFVASDPDGRNVTLELMGDDAGAFSLAADTVAGSGVSQVLSFKAKTDFEMPADANMDNVYEVTVRASDGTMHTDRMIIIKVINDAAEMGSVKLSADPAVVGVELTASVMHEEGSVGASDEIANLKWQWQTAAPAGTPATCTDDAVGWPTDTMPATTGNIADATKAAYTPKTADDANCIRAVATYNYQFATDATTVESDGALVVTSSTNLAPKFAEGARTFRVVAEDVVAADPNDDAIDDVATDNVGSPVAATDANGDTPVYTLSGSGASYFRVRDNGQIEVKGKLDHEKASSHTFTITANDGSGEPNATANIAVTIYVADVDEAPMIRDTAGTSTKQYRENGTGPVARLTATDPEGASPITWSLTDAAVGDVTADDIADRAFFKIDQNGVLSFMMPPNFEAAAGEGAAGDDNTYQVVVQASDGNNIGYHELTVEVTNVEERGSITWTVTPSGGSAIAGLQQFKPGALLTPTVTDGDGGVTVTGWRWFRGSSAISGATDATYTVVEADVRHRIRVVATYTDDGPAGPAETASFTSPNPVQAATQAANTAPAFSNTAVTRRVAENSDKGDNVGAPVTATDANGDRLTYTLGGTDVGSFKINAATGQLTVDDDIDYETDAEYTVEVTATDSSGVATAPVATVTISVNNVNEKPTFDTGSTAAGIVMAQTEGRTAIDLDNDTSTDTDVATFVASDPEGSSVTLSLMGTDAGAFMLASDTDTGNGVSRVLSFKAKTDFEMPADSNRDNVYVVTVRASDGTLHEDRMLLIKVINDATETGMVTLSGDAVVGVELTASLTHTEGSIAPSGEITGLKWQWQTADPAGTPATCTDATVAWPADTAAATAGNIADATKAMYTPVSGNEGDCLRAVATYVYQFMPVADGETGPMASSAGALVLSSQAGSAPNQAPEFAEGATTFRVVAENAKPNAATDDAATTDVDETAQGNIGTPVTAKDANGETLAYTLGGADASLFSIVANSGQLQVKSSLDHEASPTHTVTITANDQSGEANATAMITVTIYVTDVDEKPSIMLGMAPDPLTVSGEESVSYAENGTDPVGTYMATGMDADSARWTLNGDDAADFRITSGGVLRFRSSPDFEDPADADTDNAYMVTVVATAGDNMATRDVTVTVTDVDEDDTGGQPQTLLERYDANDNGQIDRDEVIQAIRDYFDEGPNAPTRDQVIEVITLYFDGG